MRNRYYANVRYRQNVGSFLVNIVCNKLHGNVEFIWVDGVHNANYDDKLEEAFFIAKVLKDMYNGI